MRADWQNVILAWAAADYDARREDSEYCTCLLNEHEDAFCVKVRRLYRKHTAADATAGDRRELVDYIVRLFLYGDFAVGKKTRLADPVGAELVAPLLALAGVKGEDALARTLGRQKDLRDALLRAQDNLVNEDPKFKLDPADMAELVRAMLKAYHVPNKRNYCEILLERHEDYLLATGELGGMTRAEVEEWLERDFYALFADNVTRPMIERPHVVDAALASDHEQLAEYYEQAEGYLNKYYAGARTKRGRGATGMGLTTATDIERERHARYLRSLFTGEDEADFDYSAFGSAEERFEYLARVLLLPDIDRDLTNLGMSREEAKAGSGKGRAMGSGRRGVAASSAAAKASPDDAMTTLGVGEFRPDRRPSRKDNLPLELVYRYYKSQGGGAREGELFDEALELYEATCGSADYAAAWIPVAPSTRVEGTRIDTPVGLFLAGYAHSRAISGTSAKDRPGRVNQAETTLMVIDPYLDYLDIRRNTKSRQREQGDQKISAANVLTRYESLEELLCAAGNRPPFTIGEKERWLQFLLDARQDMAADCQWRLQQGNPRAPEGCPERLQGFFGRE